MSARKLSVVLLCLIVYVSSVTAGRPLAQMPDESDDGFVSARCVLGQYVNATGHIFLRQRSNGGPTFIAGVIGNVSAGLHGWHIHGNPINDAENPCGSAGGHFNPFGHTHGDPGAEVRHVGDLGNFEANEFGVGVVNIMDPLVSLVGPANQSVMHRTIVIHAGTDDLGLGGDDESLRTGNAGARAGCCVIVPDEGT